MSNYYDHGNYSWSISTESAESQLWFDRYTRARMAVSRASV